MRRYGFNFQWLLVWEKGKYPCLPDERALDFMAEHGFNFVRIPMDYRFWIKDFNYFSPDLNIFKYLDLYLDSCRQRNIHLCLNIHRGPGYCVGKRNLEERDNLWVDQIAQDGFVYQWEMITRHFKGVPGDLLSFNLINEPPVIGRYGCTREIHEKLMRRTIAAIRAIDPEREIVIDGVEQGGSTMPELSDINVIQSCRGYQPGLLTHYGASWTRFGNANSPLTYPGTVCDGVTWDKNALDDFYKPWVELQNKGVKVHVGEFGCYSKTPNDLALLWYKDIIDLYRKYGWGYAMWEFEGGFGIIDHGRPGAKYERYHGYNVDRQLLDIILSGMIQ